MSNPLALQRRSELYRQYKEASSRLVCWLVNTSNRIIDDLTARRADVDEPLPAPNTTGQVRPAEIVSLAHLIAKHRAVPPAISNLLGRIIELRTETADEFARDLQSNPDDDQLRKGNEAHRHFIDVLRMAHKALGSCMAPSELHETRKDNDEVDNILFSNFFNALRIDDPAEKDDDVQDDDSKLVARQPPRKGKGKTKKRKTPKEDPKPERTKALDLPVEAYRVIHEGSGFDSDYLVAVYDLMQEAANLRLYLQEEWWRVAYDKGNTAVVGAISEMAVKLVQKAELEIFVDFPEPGHDCYETVVKTLTRGDMDAAERQFRVDMVVHGATVAQTTVDLREHLCWYAYDALVTFAEDFQQNRTGRPTKRLQKQLAGWNPELNLKKATKEERLAWRRAYTINWLYDLVNVFASVTTRKHIGNSYVLEEVDWSPEGPWGNERRIWGIARFAGFVTDIAYKKPGADIRARIRPHHVFQLQCIIDSFVVSRGWSLSLFTGHVLSAPAKDFVATRDCDLFMDADHKRTESGYICGVDTARHLLRNRRTPQSVLETMDFVLNSLINWLGSSKLAKDPDGTLPPSRFADQNGLHAYSPYLNGAGLAEALSVTSMYGLALWDQTPEVVCVIHIYNMLRVKGFLTRMDPMLEVISGLWAHAFYKDGVPPRENFADAVYERYHAESPREMRARLAELRSKYRGRNFSVAKFADAETNTFFNRNNILAELHKADWVIDRVSDSYLTDADHALTWICAMQRHEGEQALRQRAQQLGLPWSRMAERRRALRLSEKPSKHGIAASIDGARDVNISVRRHAGIASRSMLEYANIDLMTDIGGRKPCSGFNHASMMVSLLIIFARLEEALDGKPFDETKLVTSDDGEARIHWTLAVLAAGDRGDTEVLQKLADGLPRISHFLHIYWGKLITGEQFAMAKARPNPSLPRNLEDVERNAECTVM